MASSHIDFQSKDYRETLDIVDSLRSAGFNHYIDLPEIIVCGDQSAGKSSVLNALSGRDFPTQDILCTRFPTELVLRHEKTKSVSISIIPGSGRYGTEKEEISNWKPEVTVDSLKIEEIIEVAKKVMGISDANIYSDDTLRIVLCGPDQPHLTLVDLPGIFRAGNKEQPREHVEMVKRMVKRYMGRPRSIILAVVSAKSEFVLQDVMEFAQEADANKARTIGLITKPDTLDPGSESERSWFEMANNKNVDLKLGWHVLKNRSYEERHYTLTERNDAEDAFFSRGIWTSLDSSRWGIKALKNRLSSVLGGQILLQLPEMLKDVEKGISESKFRLEQLGASRGTLPQQKHYLTNVSQEFSALMSAAIQGQYSNVFFGNTKRYEGYEKRLRAVVQCILSEFSIEMRINGKAQDIIDSGDDREIVGVEVVARSDYVSEVKSRMIQAKGCELPGLFNPMIVGDLFNEQCQPWRAITEKLSADILAAVYKTTELIVHQTAANEVAEEIFSFISERIEALKNNLDAKIVQLLEPHDLLHAITYNPSLTERVQITQRSRKMRTVEKKIRQTFGTRHFDDPDSKIYVNPAQLVTLFVEEIEPDMEAYGCSIATDYMEAYYEVR